VRERGSTFYLSPLLSAHPPDCLSISLFSCCSVWLSACMFFCLSVFVISPSVCLPVRLSVCFSACQTVHMLVSSSICLSLSLFSCCFVCFYVCVSVCLLVGFPVLLSPVSLSVSLLSLRSSVFLLVRMSMLVFPSTHLSAHLSVIYLYYCNMPLML
jgi:hypothetical protein